MFGNAFVEKCLACHTVFRRTTAVPPLNRTCESCGGKLKKTGCRYGQKIDSVQLENGWTHAKKQDLSLAMGSGLHTWPFTMDGMVGEGRGRTFVVNLGRTGGDLSPNTTKINCDCDQFMMRVMEKLEIEPEEEFYSQQFLVKIRRENDDNITVLVESGRENEAVTFAEEVLISNTSKGITRYPDRNMKWTYEEKLKATVGDNILVHSTESISLTGIGSGNHFGGRRSGKATRVYYEEKGVF